MPHDRQDVRCSNCNALLARIETGALTIRRGDLEARIAGSYDAALVCYRPRCRKLNVLRHPRATNA